MGVEGHSLQHHFKMIRGDLVIRLCWWKDPVGIKNKVESRAADEERPFLGPILRLEVTGSHFVLLFPSLLETLGRQSQSFVGFNGLGHLPLVLAVLGVGGAGHNNHVLSLVDQVSIGLLLAT